jgi:hypothetical protein
VTKDEVFAQLREAFGLDSVLKRYRSLEPLDGLKEAVCYWDWAKGKQESEPSRWWDYENEKTLAYVLMGLYCWELLGHTDFPSLPDASADVRLDSHAWLCLWSRSLILDHVHQWATCRHDRRSGRPSLDVCPSVGHIDGGESHIICAICGEERFDPQPMVGRARTMLDERV